MKINFLLKLQKKDTKNLINENSEAFSKFGRFQIKKLVEKGLNIPIYML